MASCCRCNKTGRCRNCSCVKAGKQCLSCLPHRLGQCSNYSAATTAQPPALPSHSPTPHRTNGATTTHSPTPFRTGAATPVLPTSLPTLAQALSSPPPATDLPPPCQPASAAAMPSHPSDEETQSCIGEPEHSIPKLPDFKPMASPIFGWGSHDSATIVTAFSSAYSEVVHWRRNNFPVPSGSIGKSFVLELSRLFRAYAEGSGLESIALKAVTVASILLLQKPHRKSKPKDHVNCLERRMNQWRDGDINELMIEGRALQQRLPKLTRDQDAEEHLTRTFSNLMFVGKTKAALQLLTDHGKSGVLHADDSIPSSDGESLSVLGVLESKHPSGQPASASSILETSGEPVDIHPVVFDADMIRSAALHIFGAAGPSGIDAKGWRRLCTSFKSASSDLCHSLALMARRICTTYIDPVGLSPFLACRLIALDKNPGVRPIGVCETARRIIAKAILFITRGDIQDTAGSIQLCAGQCAGAEAVIHAMRESFAKDNTEAVLLVDASNAFNSLNRQTALHNIRLLCPPIATTLINTYRAHTDLFIHGSSLLSQEGTTQGDPLAMPMYAIATIPLIRSLPSNVQQAWYADDVSASGSLKHLRAWWDELLSLGPAYGYNANALKMWLITKQQYLQTAKEAFKGTLVNITTEGRSHLGAALGTREYIEQYVNKKVTEWCSELEKLTSIAETQPHAAYAATHGLASKWNYISHTTPNIGIKD